MLSALQAGSRGTQACINAASTVSGIIGDLDTTIMVRERLRDTRVTGSRVNMSIELMSGRLWDTRVTGLMKCWFEM